MGLYNFKQQFVPHIESGRKIHTIRVERRHMDRPGNTMHLYTGLRQRGARLIAKVECVRVEPVLFESANHPDDDTPPMLCFVGQDAIDRRDPLTGNTLELLAYADGFDSFAEMESFWAGKLPFVGHIYYWRPMKARTA